MQRGCQRLNLRGPPSQAEGSTDIPHDHEQSGHVFWHLVREEANGSTLGGQRLKLRAPTAQPQGWTDIPHYHEQSGHVFPHLVRKEANGSTSGGQRLNSTMSCIGVLRAPPRAVCNSTPQYHATPRSRSGSPHAGRRTGTRTFSFAIQLHVMANGHVGVCCIAKSSALMASGSM